MSKRFFYVSLGVLALAVAWHLGARSARADWDQGGGGVIAGGSGRVYFSRSGEAYVLDVGASAVWISEPSRDLPVSTSEVRFLNDYDNAFGMVLVTHSGQVWHWRQWEGVWELAPPFPGSGTATEKTSWGDVKKQFKQ